MTRGDTSSSAEPVDLVNGFRPRVGSQVTWKPFTARVLLGIRRTTPFPMRWCVITRCSKQRGHAASLRTRWTALPTGDGFQRPKKLLVWPVRKDCLFTEGATLNTAR